MADDQAKGEGTGEPKPKTTRIGGFEIIELLGKGGMGAVYKARQLSMDRIVALKVLSKRLAQNQAFVARFVREARAAAKLTHPNIVQGIDVGQAGGYYYFAMEFVDGCTVKQMLGREGPLDEKRALDIAAGVARALENAHEHGIVHRDIKPDNIMISREGAVKLADLGLARSIDKVDTVTVDGAALGTPHYMSPEQARANPNLDTRADIYALGATLYHMVTGHFPFPGPSAAAIMVRHINDPVPSAREKAPDLSRGACDLIERMMAKEPDDRPQTPTDLLQDIRDVLAGKVTLRPSRRSRRRRPVDQRPSPTAPTRAMPAAPAARPAVHRPRHTARRARRASKAPWAFAAALVLVAVALVVLLRGGGAPKPPPVLAARSAHEDAALKGRTDAQLNAALASLKAQIAPLLGKDRFGDATKLVVAFARSHRGPGAAAEASALKRTILQKAEARFRTLAAQADAAVEQRDYAKARAVLKPVASFGIGALAQDAEAKLARIDALEKAGQHTVEWTPIEDPGRAALDKVVAAYQRESNKVWAFFKDRKYAEADRLLAALAAKPEHKAAAVHVKADLEAAKLLKDFWAAVENAVAARKGKFVSIAGAAGEVLEVKDGTVRMKAGRAEYTRHIHQLTAKQAIAYAALGNDLRSKLVEGVFLLAEAADLPNAEKALAAAGDAPSIAIYTDRLAALRLGAHELAARKAWQEIQRYAKSKMTEARARRLASMLAAFRERHGHTDFSQGIAQQMAHLRRRAESAVATWVSLSDMVPGSAEVGWLQLGRNVMPPGSLSRECVKGGRKHRKFIFAHAPSSVSYRLPADAIRFTASVGLIDAAGPMGSCVFVVQADGKELFRSRKVVNTTPLVPVSADLRGATQLQLIVEDAGDGRNSDHAVWYDPKLWVTHTAKERGAGVTPGKWQSLFDGKTLRGWSIADQLPGQNVRVARNRIEIGPGGWTAITWTQRFPNINYEVVLEAARLYGNDHFCDIIFPVQESRCILQIGYWGKKIGLRGKTRDMSFTNGKWYRVRLRVTEDKIEAWLDDELVASERTADYRSSLARPYETMKPFSLAAYNATGAVRNIRLRRLRPRAGAAPHEGWPFDAAEARRRQMAAGRALGVEVEHDVDLGRGVKLTLVLIPAGELTMGSPKTTSPEDLVKRYGGKAEWYGREQPQHRVRITRPFWLGKHEITQEQWQAVMASNPSKFKGPRHPVETVNWNDCLSFLAKLNQKFRPRKFRFPTEAEWEYACRAGAATQFSFGDAKTRLRHCAWFNENSGKASHPVGRTKPNAWGLYDMHGNVWEWCGDWYDRYTLGAQVDPTGPAAGARPALRGGSWASTAPVCRSAFRNYNTPGKRSDLFGFRVARAIARKTPEPAGEPSLHKLARPAKLSRGLAVAFYEGLNHDRFLAATRVDGLDLDWGRNPPMPGLPADFSTRVVGWIGIARSDDYTFRIRRDDGARLYIDGKKVIDEWENAPGGGKLGDPATIRLAKGWHRLWVEHYDWLLDAHVVLLWRRGERESVVPASLFACEKALLSRVARAVRLDPLQGMSPTDPVAKPGG